MNAELVSILARRLTNPETAPQLVELTRAIRARSPILAQRYERVLEASGALTNPETTPEEREALLSALNPGTEARTEIIRLRVSASEREALHAAAAEAGLTLSAFIRARCLPE